MGDGPFDAVSPLDLDQLALQAAMQLELQAAIEDSSSGEESESEAEAEAEAMEVLEPSQETLDDPVQHLDAGP